MRAAVVHAFRSRPMACLALAVGTMAALGAPRTTAAASTGSWRVQASPNFTYPSGILNGVSCPTQSFCVAVGDVPDGGGALAEAWDGARWGLQDMPASGEEPGYVLQAVSCVSPFFCMAVGYVETSQERGFLGLIPVAAEWNGTTWTFRGQGLPDDGPLFSDNAVPLHAVSCTSVAFCVSVGTTAQGSPVAYAWNGTTWSSMTGPPGVSGGGLFGVSCISDQFCAASGAYETGGEVGHFELWNGHSWSLSGPLTSTGGFNSVSCSSTTACMAVGSSEPTTTTVPSAERWDGQDWVPTPPPHPSAVTSSALDAVACSGTICRAVGSVTTGARTEATLAERWNGSSWAIQPSSGSSGSLSSSWAAVSCPAAGLCTAVGQETTPSHNVVALAERWNQTRWLIQPTPDPSGEVTNALNAVSCPATTSCVAVGSEAPSGLGPLALAEVGHGATWAMTRPVNPDNAASDDLDRAVVPRADVLRSCGIQRPERCHHLLG